MLTQDQLREFKKILKLRYYQLREEVRLGLLESDHERYIDLAGQVHDPGGDSVADLLVDVQLASIDRDLEELREVDAALMRIARGGYGECLDCEGAIALERLRVNPSAARCRDCQVRVEKHYAGPGRATI
jgi:RNA polymerase-binding transcription factor DksA